LVIIIFKALAVKKVGFAGMQLRSGAMGIASREGSALRKTFEKVNSWRFLNPELQKLKL